jgi:hypothetical protein
MFDLNGSYKAVSLAHAQTITSTTTTTAVDLGPGYDEDTMVILDVGAASDTGATCAVVIKGSATSGGTYATLLTFATLADTDDNKIAAGKITRGSTATRFLKAVLTIASGSSPSFTFSIVALCKATQESGSLNSTTAA